MPAFSQAIANSAFSDMKPYPTQNREQAATRQHAQQTASVCISFCLPGCTASQRVLTAICTRLATFKNDAAFDASPMNTDSLTRSRYGAFLQTDLLSASTRQNQEISLARAQTDRRLRKCQRKESTTLCKRAQFDKQFRL